MKKTLHKGIVLFSPAILLILAIYWAPIVYTGVLSFYSYRLVGWSTPQFVGLANYLELLGDAYFWTSLKNTTIFAVTSVSIELLIGLGLALVLNKRRKGDGLILTLLAVPMMVTPVVVGVIWLLIYSGDYGILNYLLSSVGIPTQHWLSEPTKALMAITIVDVWQSTSFVLLMLSASLSTIDQDLLEAAAVDGAGAFQRFRNISLPHITPVIIVVIIIRLIDSFKEFDKVMILTRGGPGFATELLSVYNYNIGFTQFRIGHASAFSVLFVFIITMLVLCIIRLQVREG